MAEDVRKLKDKAQQLILKGKYDKALELYQAIVKADPRDVKNWVKTGDIYRKLNRPEQAIGIYEKAARSFAKGGHLMQAISVCKMILEIDPAHAETQQMLAEFYAKRAPAPGTGGVDAGGGAVRGASSALLEMMKKKKPGGPEAAAPTPQPTAAPAKPAAPPPPQPEPEPEVEESADVDIEVDAATSTSLNFDELDMELADSLFDSIISQDEVDLTKESESSGNLIEGLPEIALFSSLEREEFLSIIEKIVLKRFDTGDRIIKEGEQGDSFYIIARGQAKITKNDDAGAEILLAYLDEGDFFGEFAFFSESERYASVTVTKEMDALEINRADLEEITKRFPRVEEVMKRFYRERLLASLLSISPLFQPFADEEKVSLLEMFTLEKYDMGSVVIRQGEQGEGLYLILAGEIIVNTKNQRGKTIELARLHEGSFFGEISLITDNPTSANCMTATETEVYKLPRKTFKQLILTHPRILEVVSEYSERRTKETRSLVSGGEANLGKAGMV